MPRLRHPVEQILATLREAEVALSKGQPVAQSCRTLGLPEHTYARGRNEYGGLNVAPAQRLKAREREHTRLKRAVADLTLEQVILKEAAEGTFSAQHADGRPWNPAVRGWAPCGTPCLWRGGTPSLDAAVSARPTR